MGNWKFDRAIPEYWVDGEYRGGIYSSIEENWKRVYRAKVYCPQEEIASFDALEYARDWVEIKSLDARLPKGFLPMREARAGMNIMLAHSTCIYPHEGHWTDRGWEFCDEFLNADIPNGEFIGWMPLEPFN